MARFAPRLLQFFCGSSAAHARDSQIAASRPRARKGEYEEQDYESDVSFLTFYGNYYFARNARKIAIE